MCRNGEEGGVKGLKWLGGKSEEERMMGSGRE